MYKIEYHKRAIKDIIKLKENNLDKKTKKLIEVLKENPFQNPPPYEKLTGDLKGLYSRRINIQHRLVYKVNEQENKIKISFSKYKHIIKWGGKWNERIV